MMSLRAVVRPAMSMAARTPARRCSTMHLAGDKKLTDWEKRIMVWGGAFKNRAEVPAEVPHATYQKCQEKFRVKMNIWAMAITLGACGVAIYVGQQGTDAVLNIINTKEMKEHADLHRELHGNNNK